MVCIRGFSLLCRGSYLMLLSIGMRGVMREVGGLVLVMGVESLEN